jgi:hypothetical protein
MDVQTSFKPKRYERPSFDSLRCLRRSFWPLHGFHGPTSNIVAPVDE